MPKGKQVIALDSIVGDDEKDTSLLRKMALTAEQYIQSFEWCEHLKEGFLTDGYGGIIAMFLFRADIKKLGPDRWIWVFVGDLPSAYLEMEEYKSPYEALRRYIEGIDEWMEAARSGLPLGGLIPVEARADPDTLTALAGRSDTLRQHILPHISRNEFHSGSRLLQ
jgi:hypothetical protein